MPDFLPLTPQILRFKKIFPRLQNKTIHIIGRSCMIYKGLSVRQFPGCLAPKRDSLFSNQAAEGDFLHPFSSFSAHALPSEMEVYG